MAIEQEAEDAVPLSGGCLCGAVRYSIGALARETVTCHCRMCQKQSGSAFMGFLTVSRPALTVSGNIRHYRSSSFATRGFCPICGSALTFEYDHEPDLVGLTLGSLDDPEAVAPARHWGVESQLSWLVLADGLPQATTEDDPDFQAAIARHEGGA